MDSLTKRMRGLTFRQRRLKIKAQALCEFIRRPIFGLQDGTPADEREGGLLCELDVTKKCQIFIMFIY